MKHQTISTQSVTTTMYSPEDLMPRDSNNVLIKAEYDGEVHIHTAKDFKGY